MTKNSKLNTLIVFIIMIIVFYFVIGDHYKEIYDTLMGANKLLVLVAIALILSYYLLKALCLYKIAKKNYDKIRFGSMLKQTLITQFFNGITPFSTGGEPMQVYMLRKSGIKVSCATNIIIQDFLMYQLALVSVGLVALIANLTFHFVEISAPIYTLILLGFIINISVGLCLIFISFSKKFNNAVGKLIIKLGAKVKLIKDREKTINKWEEKLEEFNNSSKLFKKNKKLFVDCYFLNVCGLVLFHLMLFVVFKSLNIEIGIAASLISSAFVLLVGNFVPIPGGSGGIEGAYNVIVLLLIPNEIVRKSALIIWRLITYYFGIIIGAITLGFFKGEEKK